MDERALDEALRDKPTAELFRHALEEVRLLARAELLHAKHELRDELKAAKRTGILMGAGAALALSGVTLLFVALAGVLPLAFPLAALLVGIVLLGAAATAGWLGYRQMPRQPLPRTRERLMADLNLTREQFA
jgi:hypothetical protein